MTRSVRRTVLRANGLNYKGLLELPSGEYTVRFIVRDNLTGRMGTLTAPLEVK